MVNRMSILVRRGLLAYRGLATAVNSGEKTTLLKQLRDRSGAPITEVKAALAESAWDIDAAFQNLRKRGLAAASKKASRSATEGLVGIITADGQQCAALVEVNCETDFVARNDQFQELVLRVAAAALAANPSNAAGAIDVGDFSTRQGHSGASIADDIGNVAASVRENIRLRRAYRLSVPNGVVATYLHASPMPGLGRIGAMVGLERGQGLLEGAEMAAAQSVGSKIAMHIAAMKPLALDASSISEEVLAGEKAVLQEQAAAQGKPAKIVDKMVQGRLKKFFEENCLIEQRFVLDDTKSVASVVESALPGLRISSFIRVECGEGLKKEATDLARDVAALQQA